MARRCSSRASSADLVEPILQGEGRVLVPVELRVTRQLRLDRRSDQRVLLVRVVAGRAGAVRLVVDREIGVNGRIKDELVSGVRVHTLATEPARDVDPLVLVLADQGECDVVVIEREPRPGDVRVQCRGGGLVPGRVLVVGDDQLAGAGEESVRVHREDVSPRPDCGGTVVEAGIVVRDRVDDEPGTKPRRVELAVETGGHLGRTVVRLQYQDIGGGSGASVCMADGDVSRCGSPVLGNDVRCCGSDRRIETDGEQELAAAGTVGGHRGARAGRIEGGVPDPQVVDRPVEPESRRAPGIPVTLRVAGAHGKRVRRADRTDGIAVEVEALVGGVAGNHHMVPARGDGDVGEIEVLLGIAHGRVDDTVEKPAGIHRVIRRSDSEPHRPVVVGVQDLDGDAIAGGIGRRLIEPKPELEAPRDVVADPERGVIVPRGRGKLPAVRGHVKFPEGSRGNRQGFAGTHMILKLFCFNDPNDQSLAPPIAGGDLCGIRRVAVDEHGPAGTVRGQPV